MIDEDRTMQLYGYTSDKLTFSSHKPIICICEECGKYRVIRKQAYRDCCPSCGQTGKTYGKHSYEIRAQQSAISQGISISEWNGFTNKARPHIVPEGGCIKLNDRFRGSHAHHIDSETIVYIPAELHRHLNHNLKKEENMYEMNMLAIQYVNGYV